MSKKKPLSRSEFVEEMPIKASKRVSFKVGKTLKDAVNQ